MAVWRRVALPLCCSLAIWLWSALTPTPLASVAKTPRDQCRLVAVPVEEGCATVDLPARSKHDQYLILVSSLSSQAGPFPVEITTSPLANPQPLEDQEFHPQPGWRDAIERTQQLLREARVAAQSAWPSKAEHSPPPERTFWLFVRGNDLAQARNYQPVRARLQQTGQHCAVYVDREDDLTSQRAALVQEAIETFDRAVYPAALRTLGAHRDTDGDGRFTILFTHWLGQLGDGTVSVGGFVRGSDFYEDLAAPLGNRCDMMYLNSNLEPGSHLRTLIAHEYTHAVTFSQHVFGRYLPDRPSQEEESWLDEAIAHLNENQHGYSWSNLDYRISGFLNAPQRYRLVVEDYYAADLWRGHGNRGSTYLFLRWCVDQFGEQILPCLVQTNLCGVENIETTIGQPFSELYRAWSAALFLSSSGMASRADEELRSLSLRTILEGRLLAGPCYDYLSLSGETRRFAVVGTSTKYLVAHSATSAGAQVRVVADPEAKLQVSVRRLPDSLPRLEVRAVTNDLSAADEDAVSLHVQLIEHNGTPLTVDHIAWEQISSGSNKESAHACGHVVSSAEIEQLFGSTRVQTHPLTSPRLTIRPRSLADQTLVLKATGHDDAGYRVSAWCTFEAPGTRKTVDTLAGVESLKR